jgi:translation initiation factor RLI1|tara:strand:+ start:320 stop:505 length:186 start_codon:yes stop_codon:yes gene_type:complete
MDDRQYLDSVIVRIKRKLSNMQKDQKKSGSFRVHDTQELMALTEILETKVSKLIGEKNEPV